MDVVDCRGFHFEKLHEDKLVPYIEQELFSCAALLLSSKCLVSQQYEATERGCQDRGQTEQTKTHKSTAPRQTIPKGDWRCHPKGVQVRLLRCLLIFRNLGSLSEIPISHMIRSKPISNTKLSSLISIPNLDSCRGHERPLVDVEMHVITSRHN
jgi:hypothetical protein